MLDTQFCKKKTYNFFIIHWILMENFDLLLWLSLHHACTLASPQCFAAAFPTVWTNSILSREIASNALKARIKERRTRFDLLVSLTENLDCYDFSNRILQLRTLSIYYVFLTFTSYPIVEWLTYQISKISPVGSQLTCDRYFSCSIGVLAANIKFRRNSNRGKYSAPRRLPRHWSL